MRNIFILIVFILVHVNVFSQKLSTAEILSSEKVKELFTNTVRQRLGIVFPIFRAYEYVDRTGQYICVLSESRNQISDNKDTINHAIRVVTVKNDLSGKVWELNDKTSKKNKREESIWFWTKYIEFNDYDQDGVTDPVIVYGLSGMNGLDDGRINIIVYYRNRRITIRHQNAVLDYGRETIIDKAFYDLPLTLQQSIMQKMQMMINNNQAIFPAGWQQGMKRKLIKLNER